VLTAWDVSTKEGFLAWYDASIGAARRYAAQLCGADGALAEDVVHDVYVTLLAKARGGSLTQASVGLVTTALRNRYFDVVRRAQANERHLRVVWSNPSVTDTSPGDDPTAGLPPHERAALVLRYVDGLSVPEVATELGLSVHATESLLMRAKTRARKEVRRHG
jgi:RNA polymerase sigma-70 factor, ECF subfamily